MGREKRRGEPEEEMKECGFSLIIILFQWINPFLMCVFSEARKQKNLILCLLQQPRYPISLPLSSWPLESLMHYVVMIIT